MEINQMPVTASPANGEVIFDGGTLHVTAYGSGLIVYNPNYGFSAITTFQGTSSILNIDNNALFRTDGYNAGNLMGNLTVNGNPTSIFKVSGLAGGGTSNTSGTGSVDFSGGNVQFTPTDGAFLLPQDGAFSLHLNGTAADELLFSGCPNSSINGNLYFNDDPGSSAVAIDGAIVDNTPTPFASAWEVGGTGLTSWNGTVFKESTQAVPGGGGPFTTGTVIFNRCAAAPVNVAAGSLLQVDAGTVIATGGTDPFTDNSTGVTHGNHITVINNAALEVLDVNSTIQTINGTGTLTVGDGVTTNTLHLATGGGQSSQNVLSIVGSSSLDINNNHMFINYGGGPDPINSIADWIISGYAGGAWNGPGIMSTMAQSNPSYGIGYADSADPGNPAGLAPGQIEIKYTLLGDANLDSKVNGTDFNLMAANFNDAVTNGWDKGDFNYDGKVNGSDFVLLADNFNQFASQSAVAADDLAALEAFAAANGISLANVPEPASAAMMVVAGLGILRRRRRSR